MTKDEVANFVWSHLSKADANHDNAVTKDELKAFAKQRFETMRAEHREKVHKAHEAKNKAHEGKKQSKPAKPAEKPKEEKPKPVSKAAVTPETKALAKTELKAEIKPALKGNSQPAARAAAVEKVKDPKAGTSAT